MKVTRIFKVKKEDPVDQAKVKRLLLEGFLIIRVVDEGDRDCIHMLRIDGVEAVRTGIGPSEYKEVSA